jgi:hypothetical protein
MALRIIRKSSSQSHVEVIRGTASGSQPELTVLCHIQSLTELEAFKVMISESEWLQENAEWVVMKGPDLQEQLRPYFQPLNHSIKLMNTPDKASLNRCFRTLIQEATSEYCCYLPWAPAADQLLWLTDAVAFLKSNPNHAAVSPVFCVGEKILAAGTCLVLEEPKHTLILAEHENEIAAIKQRVLGLGQGVAQTDWLTLLNGPVSLPSLPLPLLLLRRNAYLGLSWEDSHWDADWLAQDICIGLRQQQYWLHLLPSVVVLPERLSPESVLSGSLMPETFSQRWRPVFREALFGIYGQLGFEEKPDRVFLHVALDSADPVAAYFAELKVS